MNNKPILFFSQNDTNSKEIWNYIKSKNMLEKFNKISTIAWFICYNCSKRNSKT